MDPKKPVSALNRAVERAREIIEAEKAAKVTARKAEAGRADTAAAYKDPTTTKVEDWQWRPLTDARTDLGNISAVPDYVQSGYGDFMKDQLARAGRGDLSARDLIKAYTITQSSIGRGGLSHSTATKQGLRLPDTGEQVRPEGAFAEWLGSPMGQRYLNTSELGTPDPAALRELQRMFSPFGKQNDQVEKMQWAAEHLPMLAKDLNARVTGPIADWRDYSDSLKGIAAAKSGFVGSLLGRGDIPTLDARQLNLHGTTPPVGLGSIQNRGGGTGGREIVDRLIARQEAMGLDLDPSLAPFYQHLGHHAVWDKIGGTETTHSDLVKAMRNYQDGGAVHMNGGGKMDKGLGAGLKAGMSAYDKAKAMIEAENAAKKAAVLTQAEREANLRRAFGNMDEAPEASAPTPTAGQASPSTVTHGMLKRKGIEIANKEEADALYSKGHRIFGMHEMDEVPFEITDRKLFDSYAPDMMLAYPPDMPMAKADGGMITDEQDPTTEAIKNTVRDPQVARMFDLDLAKLALLNQPRRMAQGGQVLTGALGGEVQTPVRGDMANMSFEDYRKSIGMHEGGKHMAGGGRVQRFDEGGQAERDQRDNSPSMQATPRSNTQKLAGTVGEYMDKAGRFVNEALEPIAKTNPIKTGLVNMLVADSLKNAGTALQDYSGTVRETDENNPVRGLISKDWRNLTTSREPLLDPRALDIAGFAAPVIKGATRAAKAGANVAAPYASKVDDMVREMYESGAMPQPGLSIKSVNEKPYTLRQTEQIIDTAVAKYFNNEKLTGEETRFLRLDHPAGGGVNLSRLPSEYTAEFDMERPLKPRKIITPEKMQDQASIGLVGDSADAAKRLIAVNDAPLSGEVNIDGGFKFMRDNPDKWASGKAVITKLDNQIERALENVDEVYTPTVSMSATGVDFNAMMTETVLNMFNPLDLPKVVTTQFDNTLKNTPVKNQKTGEIKYPFKNFVGLRSPYLRDQLFSLDDGTGNLRKAFIETMNQSEFQKMGFPEPAAARFAISDPALIDKPIGSTGYEIAKFKPSNNRIITDPKVRHGTYPVHMGGPESSYAGSLGETVPYDVWFKDFFKQRRAENKPTSSDARAFTMSTPIQYHDQAWLDNMMKYITARDKKIKTGSYAAGGAVQGFDEGGDVDLPTAPATGVEPRITPKRKGTEESTDYMRLALLTAKNLGQSAKEQAGEELANAKANPRQFTTDVLNNGMVAGNVGAPVDLVNLGFQGADALGNIVSNTVGPKLGFKKESKWYSDKPVMGSEWIKDRLADIGATSGQENPMSDFVASLFNPVAGVRGAAKAAPVVGEKVLKPLAEKGLTMYEKGQLTPGFKPVSEIFAGSRAQGADLGARDTAKARLAAGEDPNLVRQETGWAAPPWAPNELRFEISDDKMTAPAIAAVKTKHDAHISRMSDIYYAQEIKRNLLAGDSYDDALAKAVTTAQNAGFQYPITPKAEAIAKDPNITRSELTQEFDKGKVKKLSTINRLSGKLDKNVDHADFYARYPDFGKWIDFKTLSVAEVQKGYEGSFSPWDATLKMSAPVLLRKPEEALDTIIHELQHGVQSREAWNNGGNPAAVVAYPTEFDPISNQLKQDLTIMMSNDKGRLGTLYRQGQYSTATLSSAELRELDRLTKASKEYQDLERGIQNFVQSDTKFNLYQRLAGEAEARLAAARRKLTPEERKKINPYDPHYFYKTTGYDIHDIIPNPVRSSNSFSQPAKPAKKAGGKVTFAKSADEMRKELSRNK